MNRPAPDLTAFLQEVRDIPCTTAADQLRMKSRDFYWYSPILQEQLAERRAEAVVSPRTEEEVLAVARAAALHGVPLTVRGGGTGNYGQCVPLAGGVVLDVTGLNQLLELRPGLARVQAGLRLGVLQQQAHAQGQQLLMYPSTLRAATVGGFIAGGSAGIGSIRNGILKDPGNVLSARVVTLEAQPRVLTLEGEQVQKVHHAYGTNGIITEITLALQPRVEWRHVITVFDSYAAASRFCTELPGSGIDLFLLTSVERGFSRYYTHIEKVFPAGRDAVFAMVAPESLEAYAALGARCGGVQTMALTERELHEQRLPPAYECAYNHTTLQALKIDKGWTYLQFEHPHPFDPTLCVRLKERWGDEFLAHDEFLRTREDPLSAYGLPLVRFTTPERQYEIMRALEAEGCVVFDPHVYTIEDGGMKTIDQVQLDFKRQADPAGLMNPGKMRAWEESGAGRKAA
ncbi:FAD-binding oxidoreductase [Ramlibacter sp. AN1015]|uniref:FAD-binding oxidoreductase n=1 Tax=Ramlibacter sp. AN1015 TaxID=3133428 RepID=UPI0030C06974